ncbi:hypothetical protein [Winogradskyella sp.]|uniref:hypothetical protein n=1 Tax=Winogradskyella sp. TaxID=1883156 RepID=UPI003513FBBA
MIYKSKTLYSIILVLSLVLFLAKGIQYALLGSYIPIFLAIVICMLFYFNRNRKRSLKTLIKIWAILIIIWAIMRIAIGLADRFGKELMENHLQEHLGIKGIFISLVFLIGGIYLLGKKRRHQWVN